jgi:iron(III) transport system substrate-binding protein
MWRLAIVLGLALLTFVAGGGVGATTVAVDDPALIAAAKREGSVVLYSTFSAPDTDAIAQRFQSMYGITMQTLRADPASMATRILTEQHAGHFGADTTIEAGFQADQLKRAGALERYPLPEDRDLLRGTYDPDGYWSAVVLNSEVIGFNTARLKELGLKAPRTWDDLARKEWHGNFGLYASSFEWFQAMQTFFGKDYAVATARAFAANQPQLLASHTQLVTQLVDGEIAATADAYGYDVLLQKDHGAPVDFVNPDPTVLELATIQVVKNPPHPNAARLMARWIESRDTQAWIRATMHRVTARKDIQNDPRLLDPKIRYVISDPSDSVHAPDVIRAYNEIFGRPY